MKIKFLCAIIAILCVFSVCFNSCSKDEDSVSNADQTWAVYWYLCGSDLETKYQAASEDLTELLSVTLPENVTFVIQTGGSEQWHSYGIDSNAIERYTYDSYGFHQIESLDNASMGDIDTLDEFVEFCLENYPADKKVLLFWNHGGGSIGGICKDEVFNEILSLNDIASVLEYYQEDYDEPIFELIGFDACLMATIDTAYTLSDYALYLVASEETEPGVGWDYSGFAGSLARNTGITGAALGKSICDSYQSFCDWKDLGDNITLSVIDLSKTDELFEAYDDFGYELLSSSLDFSGFFGKFNRLAKNAENYGGNSRSEGFTNMVDLGHIARESYRIMELESAQTVLEALDNCVVYSIAGPYRNEATGLSCYYPLDNSQHSLSVFSSIGTSWNFAAYYDYVLQGNLTEDNRRSLSSSTLSESQLDNAPAVPSISALGLDSIALEINEDGYAVMELGPETADLISGVYNWIMLHDEEEDLLILLGRDNNLDADWENGIFADNFHGEWTRLDGHLVNLNLDYDGDDYNMYHIPILLNGEEYHLQVTYLYETEEYKILGARKGVESSGMSGRYVRKLQEGDEITTLFYIFVDMENEDEDPTLYPVETFTIGANPVVADSLLPDGKYFYLFEVEDAQSESVYSDPVAFYVEDGELSW